MAALAVEFLGEQPSAGIEPIDDRVGVFWHGGSENDEGVP